MAQVPLRRLRVDALVALAVGTAALGSALFTRWDRSFADHPHRGGPHFHPEVAPPEVSGLVFAAVAVLVLALAVRRIAPWPAYLGVVVGTAGYLAAGGPYGVVLTAPALALYALAGAVPGRRWAPAALALVPMLTAGFWSQPYAGLLDPGLYPAVVFGSAAIVLPTLVGLVRRARREADRREREAELRRYAYEERLRMAREVHDVVGHSLSVISLQAGVARHVWEQRPDQVTAALDAIRQTSKDALAELRTTLAVYRGDGADAEDRPVEDAPRAPEPGLDRLPQLVSALRSAGRDVDVEVDDGATADLPHAVDHAAYRIVQEALTNVVRHAGPAAARVSVTRQDGALVAEVRDDGKPVAATELADGSGLAGMRERAASLGGRVTVRPGLTGGVQVRAELPLPRPATLR